MADEFFDQVPLIPRDEISPTSGKSVDSLAYSRKQRDDILRMFRGELPMSIMQADKSSRDNDDLATGTYFKTSNVKDDSKLSKIFDVSGQSVRGGALSIFPQNIGRAMIMLYTKPGDTIVDPFAGHNSRMELAILAGRNYIGQDLSKEFMIFNREQQAILKDKFPELNIILYEGDSRKMQAPDESGDFTITSPPYWDIEYYGDEPEQLGKRSYADFLKGLGQVAKENYRCLKPGSFCVWFINDFRKNGKFYPYHIDTFHLLESAGFQPWDMMITDLGYPIKAAFATQIVNEQILPKRHEYGVIVRKPGWNNKKVVTVAKTSEPEKKEPVAKVIKEIVTPKPATPKKKSNDFDGMEKVCLHCKQTVWISSSAGFTCPNCGK